MPQTEGGVLIRPEIGEALPAAAPGAVEGVPVSSARKAFYHPELDVLRFFAFLLVFVGHADFDPRMPIFLTHPRFLEVCLTVHQTGFTGLSLFFGLSSYLITELLLSEEDRTGRIHFGDFYVRRMLRIWPLYFFFLLAVRPFAAHFLPYEHFSNAYLASYLLLVGNWYCFRHNWAPSIATPLWSISIEEQFYLVWPLVVSRFRRQIPAIAMGMLVVANVLRWHWVDKPHSGMWTNTFTRLDPFALGALAAYYLHGRRFEMPAGTRVMLALVALMLLMLTGRYGLSEGLLALFYYPMEALACVLLLLAVLIPVGRWTPGVAGRVFVYLGRISYGLYVYHLMWLWLVGKTTMEFLPAKGAALVLTIATAAVSYAVVERPFLRLKQRFTYVRSRM